MNLPPVVLQTHEGILVVRDDLLPGGTKRRVIGNVLLNGTGEKGFGLSKFQSDEFVYASPACGYAQVALAYACQDLEKKATIFVAHRSNPHDLTKQAKALGAKIVTISNGRMNCVKARARDYAVSNKVNLLPFGFDCEEMREGLANVARSLKIKPKEVWTVVGSGTLIRSLQIAWPKAQFHAVRVGCKTSDIGRAKEHIAPERFEQDAKSFPPFPSCSSYDAKAWQFVVKYASPGALLWNVGR